MPATPDTSAKNVARVLRRLNSQLSLLLADKGQVFAERADLAALADALDQQAAAPTWEERERAAWWAWVDAPDNEREGLAAALRAAFPEYAPND